MPSATSKGYRYPLPSDPVSSGAADIQNLASDLDTKAGVWAAGIATVVVGTAGPSGSVVVTYPASRFSATPVVGATMAMSSSSYVVGTGNLGPTGCTIYAFHKDAGTNIPAGSYSVHWIARGVG